MRDWLILTTLETSVLIGVVVLARPLIRRAFGAVLACDLWLIPAIGVLLPTRPPRPETVLETIPLPAAAEVSRGVSSAVEAWAAPSTISWEALWLAGVCLWVAVQLVRSARFRRHLQTTATRFVASSSAIVELLERHGVSPERVFFTEYAGAPFVTGLIHAKVFLPLDFRAMRRYPRRSQTTMRRLNVECRSCPSCSRPIACSRPRVWTARGQRRRRPAFSGASRKSQVSRTSA